MECSRPKEMHNHWTLALCTLTSMLVPDLLCIKKVGKCLNVPVALRCEQMRLRLLSTEIKTSQNKNIWGLAFEQDSDSRACSESCFAFATFYPSLYVIDGQGVCSVTPPFVAEYYLNQNFLSSEMLTWHLISLRRWHYVLYCSRMFNSPLLLLCIFVCVTRVGVNIDVKSLFGVFNISLKHRMFTDLTDELSLINVHHKFVHKPTHVCTQVSVCM